MMKHKPYNLIVYVWCGFSGSLIDAIEYYLIAKKNKISVKLLIFNINNFDPMSIFDVINDRYDIDFEYKNDILFECKLRNIIKYTCHTGIILNHSTIEMLPLAFKFERLLYIYEHKDDKLYSLYKKIDHLFDNVHVYKEMDYEYGHPYKCKFAFDLFKPLPNACDPYSYMNCFSKSTTVVDYAKTVANYPLIISINNNNKNESLNYINDITIWKEHPINYWKSFKEYVYIHDGIYWDPRPRMFHECKFYNKDIIYINKLNIKDGSYYRYNDANNNGWNHRNLTMNDEILKMCL